MPNLAEHSPLSRMLVEGTLATLALISGAIGVWQYLATRRFPLHTVRPLPPTLPGITVLKPLKGAGDHTHDCLLSWLTQDYPGPVQILFGVANPADPSATVVRQLISSSQHPDVHLVPCPLALGLNGKVSTLLQLLPHARHPFLVVSDDDIRIPPTLLAQVMAGFDRPRLGLISCFYRFTEARNLPSHWEAIGVNVDFWSQVLQSCSFRPLHFGLGALMAMPRRALDDAGGFEAIRDSLADDYQLGARIAAAGWQLDLSPAVVDCPLGTTTWNDAWTHQVRWARTMRVCQPLPYFLSLAANATLWPLLLALSTPSPLTAATAAALLGLRLALAQALLRRFYPRPSPTPLTFIWLKDLLQAVLWAAAFLGSTIHWRGSRLRVRRNGTLQRDPSPTDPA